MRAARQGGPRGWEGKWGRTGHVRCRARWGAPLNPYSVSLRCGNYLRSGNDRADRYRVTFGVGRGAKQFKRAMIRLSRNRLLNSMTVVGHLRLFVPMLTVGDMLTTFAPLPSIPVPVET